MPRKKKNTMDGMEQTHALDESRPTTLDQVWGDTGISKFNTLDEDVYEERLADMNLSDLQAEAYRVGLVPVHSRELLTSRLLREFRRHASEYGSSDANLKPATKNNLDANQERLIRKILSS